MAYTRLLLLLLLLVYPLFIKCAALKMEDEESEDSDKGDLLFMMQNFSSVVLDRLANIDASEKQDKANKDLKNKVSDLVNVVKAQSEMIEEQGEKIQDQDQNIRDLRKSLDKRLRENDLKIEWSLTDGTLAPKNTSGIMKNLARQEKKIDESLDMLREVRGYSYQAGSCAEIDGGHASGVHRIYPKHGRPVLARCESSTGGGWTVIQKRFDGSVDFYRGWEEYAEGFGDPASEFWLGLRHIHALTQGQRMELYVGVTDFDIGHRFAKYASFSVSSEDDKFRLSIGPYSGNAGDSLRYHNFERFSTRNHDNDSGSRDCSNSRHGAWWYMNCDYSNLNGLFSKVKRNGYKYMTWYYLHNDRKAMKASIMMIRPANFSP